MALLGRIFMIAWGVASLFVFLLILLLSDDPFYYILAGIFFLIATIALVFYFIFGARALLRSPSKISPKDPPTRRIILED